MKIFTNKQKPKITFKQTYKQKYGKIHGWLLEGLFIGEGLKFKLQYGNLLLLDCVYVCMYVRL